jgi:hypothetical protein
MKLSRALSTASLVTALCLGGTAAAWDSDAHYDKALVLGDSVAFGYIATVDSAHCQNDCSRLASGISSLSGGRRAGGRTAAAAFSGAGPPTSTYPLDTRARQFLRIAKR